MLPKGWKAVELEDLASFHSGGTPSKSTPTFWGGEFPWISAKDLKKHFISNSIEKLSDIGFKNAAVAPSGSSLVLVRGMTLLKRFPVGFALRPVAFNQDIKALLPKKNTDPLFLSFLLAAESHKIRQMVSTAGHGTGRLDTTNLKEYPVLLPPLPEQKKIAAILSTWDRAIEETEKLLANSQQQKKALMQQLLTGKKRLPGFTGEWKTKTLGEIGEISSAGVDKKIIDGEEPVQLLNFTDVFNRTFIHSHDLHHWVTAPSTKVKKCNVKKGDVFFTPSSETRNDIAFSAVAAEDIKNCCYSYHVVRLRFKVKFANSFKAFIFSTMRFRKKVYKLADGSGQRYVISQDDFRSIEISYPSFEEQCQIGAILQTTENEIATIKSDLSRLRDEKKALMQQLLTGKRRVKVDQEISDTGL